MPYDKVRGHPDCGSGQIAVVNTETGQVMGCHDTDDSANAQLAALNAAEPHARSLVHYRTFEPDLEVRSGGDGRTIVGIAVPYGKPQRITAGLVEQFARGAFNHQLREPHRIRFSREHVQLGGVLIGTTRVLRDDPAGLYGEWYVSRTPAGDETLELVRDGALRQLSIAFRERQNRILPDGTVERVKADAREVAVVMEGAYGDLAVATGIRSANDTNALMAAGVRSIYLPNSGSTIIIGPQVISDRVDAPPVETPRLEQARRLLRDLKLS